MRTIRPGPGRVWKNTAVLMCVAAVSLFFIATGLLADPPDSTQPSLREGTFVMRDTTTHPPSPVSPKALERLNANSTERWNVQWHRTTGLPGIGGGATKKKYEGSPEEIALAFVEDYKDLFLGTGEPNVLRDYTFEIRNSHSFGRYTMVGLQAYFRGVKLHEGWLSIDITDDGQPKSAENSLWKSHFNAVVPSLSLADIEQLIQEEAAPLNVLKPSQIGELWPHEETVKQIGTKYDEVELVIYPSSPPRLAYYMSRIIGDLRFWRIIVDAHTGEIISAMAPTFETPAVKSAIPSTTDSVGADSSGETATKSRLLPPPHFWSQAKPTLSPAAIAFSIANNILESVSVPLQRSMPVGNAGFDQHSFTRPIRFLAFDRNYSLTRPLPGPRGAGVCSAPSQPCGCCLVIGYFVLSGRSDRGGAFGADEDICRPRVLSGRSSGWAA